MNTTFDFSRFLKVLSNEWRLNIKKMLLFWGCMIIIAVLYFFLFGHVERGMIPKKSTFGLLFFLACILQGFYLQIYYREFSSKTKTQALLLLPASRNETFWVKFLLGVLLYLIIFSAYIFIVIQWNEIHNNWIKELNIYPADDWRYRGLFEDYQTLRYNLMTKLLLFLVWLFSASAYLYGLVSFKKLAAFKSLAFWFIIVAGLWLITCIIYALFTGVWTLAAFPGITIAADMGCAHYLAQYQIHSRGSANCTISSMYPEFLYGVGIFICLALIFISRIKYNEKTV